MPIQIYSHYDRISIMILKINEIFIISMATNQVLEFIYQDFLILFQ